jgi:hypothetical protein
MESRTKDRSSQEQTPDDIPESEKRWGHVLQKVVAEQQTNDPWYVKLGISLAWSAGIALAAGIVATLVLAIRALLSAEIQFGLEPLSNHTFWAAALLMVAGMFSPSAADLERSRNKKKEQDGPRTMAERRARALERRLRRVYDPWRWRVWGGAALTFGLTVLFGLLGIP